MNEPAAAGASAAIAPGASAPDTTPRNAVDRAVVAISKVVSAAFALSVAVTIYDVLSDVIAVPTLWVYDVVTTAIAVAFLIGGSYALQRREHIQITALYDRYPKRAKLICDVISLLGTICYLAAFGWFAWRMAYDSVVDWEVGGSAWAQPTPVIVKVSMFLGVVMLILQALSNIREDIRELRALGDRG